MQGDKTGKLHANSMLAATLLCTIIWRTKLRPPQLLVEKSLRDCSADEESGHEKTRKVGICNNAFLFSKKISKSARPSLSLPLGPKHFNIIFILKVDIVPIVAVCNPSLAERPNQFHEWCNNKATNISSDTKIWLEGWHVVYVSIWKERLYE